MSYMYTKASSENIFASYLNFVKYFIYLFILPWHYMYSQCKNKKLYSKVTILTQFKLYL